MIFFSLAKLFKLQVCAKRLADGSRRPDLSGFDLMPKSFLSAAVGLGWRCVFSVSSQLRMSSIV